MEIFKFLNPRGDTLLEQGEIINGLTDVMWVERYRDNGEFTLKAPVDSNVRAQLPPGTLISHADSTDVMIVENHEISNDKGDTSDVVITGRSFETFLENRVIFPQHALPADVVDYTLVADFTWNQAWALMSNHIYAPLDPNDKLQNVMITHTVTGTGTQEARVIRRGTLYSAVLDILSVDGLGLKVIRPNPSSPFGATDPNLGIVIHKGADKTKDVIFSYDAGDIDTADYLWSIKSLKNAALVSGRWIEIMVEGPEAGYDRRMMYIDGSFIDNPWTAAPNSADRTTIINAMTTLGTQALARQKELALTKVDVSRNVKHYMFRKDFDVGDIITVAGDYDETTTMRVIEYVEIEDSNGESGYPTLATL